MTKYKKTPHISIHLTLDSNPHNNTPHITIISYYIIIHTHYNTSNITTQSYYNIIHTHYNTPNINTTHLILHDYTHTHYNTPNIAIHPTIQYTQHYNIKRGSLFNVELILKPKNRLQYVYCQYQ